LHEATAFDLEGLGALHPSLGLGRGLEQKLEGVAVADDLQIRDVDGGARDVAVVKRFRNSGHGEFEW
jgi:hypothetical protein